MTQGSLCNLQTAQSHSPPLLRGTKAGACTANDAALLADSGAISDGGIVGSVADVV